MTLLSALGQIFIGPLKLVFEIIFSIANRFIGHPGLAIIFLSLIMNILVLPLYRRADAMQEEARDIDAKLKDGITHIKKTFSGDERMMILQTYYRQNNYSPVSALNGSVSLLLEIPFFMAAYQFLSHLDILDGVSLGPITDLGAPDGLLVIGGLAINLLPILMTLINVISSAIYLKGFPLKTKIQLYALAAFFLVFLYNSPACLVFYWTLNNVFSLAKNIVYKLKNPRAVLSGLSAFLGVFLLIFTISIYQTPSIKRKIFLGCISVALLLPVFLPEIQKYISSRSRNKHTPNKKLFFFSSLFISILTGILIPSTFIASSPLEFVDINYFYNPLWFVVSCSCLSFGTFMVWMRVFYWLSNDSGKVIFEKIICVLCGIMLVNYMFFGTNLGVIYSNLQYETGMLFSSKEIILNLAVLAVLSFLMYSIVIRYSRTMVSLLLTACFAFSVMSAINCASINRTIEEFTVSETSQTEEIPNFQLSRNGQNVVVIMLDRGLNQYVPYIFNEKPELIEKFDGFTYYSNTISYGLSTNLGSPALLGGYEYTPIEMNKRDTELLVDKHNEALKVMPVLFSEEGYDVTVFDPVYANYLDIPDLSIYNDYPEIDAYITRGQFDDVSQSINFVNNNNRNFFCFSVMKCMPIFIQPTIYNGGMYNQASVALDNQVYSTQVAHSSTVAEGIYATFMSAYNVLVNMNTITNIVDDGGNTFLLMTNDTPHEPTLLQTPDYTPAQYVDNTEYDATHADRFTLNGKSLSLMDSSYHLSHYHVNVAAFMQLSNWFDYLRKNDVYDNTRILLVSDHGRILNEVDELITDDGTGEEVDFGAYYPLLMVKDFNSHGFTTSEEFMTNADVPTLATNDLIESPVNPFTGKSINNTEKTAHPQFISRSTEYQITINNGTTYMPSKWVAVENSIWNPGNWTFINDSLTLSEHQIP